MKDVHFNYSAYDSLQDYSTLDAEKGEYGEYPGQLTPTVNCNLIDDFDENSADATSIEQTHD